GRIEDFQSHFAGLGPHGLRHTVRREHHDGARWGFMQLVDEDGALGLQVLDDVAVMDDFVPDINGRAVELESPLDDVDGPVDSRAKAARLRQHNFRPADRLHVAWHYRTPNKETSTCRSAPARG